MVSITHSSRRVSLFYVHDGQGICQPEIHARTCCNTSHDLRRPHGAPFLAPTVHPTCLSRINVNVMDCFEVHKSMSSIGKVLKLRKYSRLFRSGLSSWAHSPDFIWGPIAQPPTHLTTSPEFRVRLLKILTRTVEGD